MSTTMMDTTEAQEPSWTLKEVEKQESTLADLREKQAERRRRLEELKSEIADAVAEGEDPTELREERDELREALEQDEGLPELLEAKIEERREAACRQLAEERIQTIKRKRGGIAGEHPRRVERLEEAVEAAEREIGAMNAAYRRQEAYRREARALADRFELEVPEMKEVRPPAGDAEVQELMERLRDLSPEPRIRRTSPKRRRAPVERVRRAVKALEEHGEESPSPEIITEAGALDPDAWEEELDRRKRERKRRKEEEREARWETITDWLRERLKNGPVESSRLRSEAYDAGEVGELLSSMGGDTFSKATRRAGLVKYAREGDRRGTYLGLPGVDTGEGSPWRLVRDLSEEPW